MLGLPVRLAGEPYHHLLYGSAEVLFLGVDPDLHLGHQGALSAHAEQQPDDQCVMSCVDWYGNSRPVFYRDRIFALMGYELVEGVVSEDSMLEIERENFYLGGLGR